MQIIRQRNGAVRVMEDDNVELQEGETILKRLPEQLHENGIKWGDVVAWAAKKVGAKQCAPCKARQTILNHIQQNGVVETIRLIKETIK
jgi:hypothetical protein